MNVLITGGIGVNGAMTARLMVKESLRPVLLDNRMDLSLMRDIQGQVDCVEADVCDQQALEKIVDDYKVTHIAHLAALMPEPAEANPRLGIKVGVDGTVNVFEVARAIYLAVKAERPGESVFNIGTGKASTPRDFLDAASKIFPNHRIELGPGPSKLGRSKQSYCVFDISAAKKHLGYEPSYDVEQGVKDYVETLNRLGR